MRLQKQILLHVAVSLIVGIILVVSLVTGLMFAFAPKWMDGTVAALRAEEIASLKRIAVSKSGFLEEVFSQIQSEATLLSTFAGDISTGTLSVTSPPQTYYTLPTGSNGQFDLVESSALRVPTARVCSPSITVNCWHDPPGGLDANGENFEASAFFVPGLTQLSALSAAARNTMDRSAALDSAFKELHSTNPSFMALYVGYQDMGMFRVFPYTRRPNYPSMRYTIAGTNTVATGYDPRNRGWYKQAVAAGTLVFTAPYVDAFTGQLVITAAMPVRGPGNAIVGVVGVDIRIPDVKNAVLGNKILVDGYGFVVSSSGTAVIHPTVDPSQPPTSITQEEFIKADTPTSGPDAAAFQATLAKMTAQQSGTTTFSKNGEVWHLAYAPIPTPKFSLALVVPERDILAPATATSRAISEQLTIQVVIFILVLLLVTACVFKVATVFAAKVVQPIVTLKEVCDTIASDLSASASMRGNLFTVDVDSLLSEEQEGCAEVSLLKHTFHSLVSALRFGNDAYDKNDLGAAVKMYQDASAMFAAMNNSRGVGICDANLGVVYHQFWMKSEARSPVLVTKATECYRRAVSEAAVAWMTLCATHGVDPAPGVRDSDVQTEAHAQEAKALDVVAATGGDGDGDGDGGEAKETEALRRPAPATGLAALEGSDIADRLAQRKAQLALLLSEADGQAEGIALLNDALAIDNATINTLSRASHEMQLVTALLSAGDVDGAYTTATNALHSASAICPEGSMAALECPLEEHYRCIALQAALIAVGDVLHARGEFGLAFNHYNRAITAGAVLRPSERRSALFGMLRCAQQLGEGASDAHAALTQVATDLGLLTAPTKDVVFVLDYSGSMAGGKIRRARTNLIKIFEEHIGAEDRVSLVVFSSRVHVYFPLQPKGEAEAMMREKLNSLTSPRYQTAFFDAVGNAMDQLRPAKIEGRSQWCVALTDGCDNKSSAFTPPQLRDRIRQQKVNTVVLAVGVDSDDAIRQMQTIVSGAEGVEGTTGMFIDIRQSELIDQAFATISEMLAAPQLQVESY